MVFEVVVGRQSLTSGKEKLIAGFLKLEKAKDYAEQIEIDYLTNGYMYVETLDGRFILGADRKTEMNKWYAPNELAYVFDTSKDSIISLKN